jgi:hypothetical protein
VIVVSSVQQWPRLPDLRALLGRAVAALVACGCGGQQLSGAGVSRPVAAGERRGVRGSRMAQRG